MWTLRYELLVHVPITVLFGVEWFQNDYFITKPELINSIIKNLKKPIHRHLMVPVFCLCLRKIKKCIDRLVFRLCLRIRQHFFDKDF